MKRYQHLLFDNDGTLMDFASDQAAAFRAAYQHFPCRAQRPYSPALLAIYQRANARWWHKFDCGACTKDELQLARFRDFLAEAGLVDNPILINELYRTALEKENQLIEGALSLVKALSQRYVLHIVTNGIATTQHSRLGTSALRPYLAGIYVSEDMGHSKPAKEYFDQVLKAAGILDPSLCLVIGDSLTSDMQGANNAGLDCVWYNPAGLKNTKGLRIDYEVQSLTDLLEMLIE